MKFILRMRLVQDHHSISSHLEKYTYIYTHTGNRRREKRWWGEREKLREEIGPAQVKSDKLNEFRGQ